MPYIYPAVQSLNRKPKISDGECISLVRAYTDVGPTSRWRQGATVFGNKNIATGTAIATFVNGRWPALARGNHAALYVGQSSDGIYVLDQWNDAEGKKTKMEIRKIQVRPKLSNGRFVTPSDNALAFSVIETP